jgi:hypothetical protein
MLSAATVQSRASDNQAIREEQEVAREEKQLLAASSLDIEQEKDGWMENINEAVMRDENSIWIVFGATEGDSHATLEMMAVFQTIREFFQDEVYQVKPIRIAYPSTGPHHLRRNRTFHYAQVSW